MSDPHHLAIARRYLGLAETSGPHSNPAIIAWAASLGGWIAGYYRSDDIPWCALFVCHVLAEAGRTFRPTLSAGDFYAYGGYGKIGPSALLGAILVFKRPGGHHVGFCVAEDATHYHVLGGNQGDRVSIVRIPKSRCIAVRYPADEPLRLVAPQVAASGRVSTKEA